MTKIVVFQAMIDPSIVDPNRTKFTDAELEELKAKFNIFMSSIEKLGYVSGDVYVKGERI